MSPSREGWRPQQIIRPLAIGLIARDDELLVMEVVDVHGRTRGWRPPGGSIEFGERAEDALVRELLEELGEDVRVLNQIGVLENIYSHNDAAGHEIVFVFTAEFSNHASYATEQYLFEDGGVTNRVVRKKISDFVREGHPLYPSGLLDYLT